LRQANVAHFLSGEVNKFLPIPSFLGIKDLGDLEVLPTIIVGVEREWDGKAAIDLTTEEMDQLKVNTDTKKSSAGSKSKAPRT